MKLPITPVAAERGAANPFDQTTTAHYNPQDDAAAATLKQTMIQRKFQEKRQSESKEQRQRQRSRNQSAIMEQIDEQDEEAQPNYFDSNLYINQVKQKQQPEGEDAQDAVEKQITLDKK